MGQRRTLDVFGLEIVWDGGREVLVRNDGGVIERHATEPMQPRRAASLINRIETELVSAAKGMEEVA